MAQRRALGFFPLVRLFRDCCPWAKVENKEKATSIQGWIMLEYCHRLKIMLFIFGRRRSA